MVQPPGQPVAGQLIGLMMPPHCTNISSGTTVGGQHNKHLEEMPHRRLFDQQLYDYYTYLIHKLSRPTYILNVSFVNKAYQGVEVVMVAVAMAGVVTVGMAVEVQVVAVMAAAAAKEGLVEGVVAVVRVVASEAMVD